MKYLYRFGWYFAYIYWFIRRPKTKGSCIIVESNNSVLLVRHTYGRRNLWFFPGGGIKKNEGALSAAKRELKEETGLNLDLKFIGEASGKENWRQVTDSYYIGYSKDKQLVKDNREIADFRWWPKNHLPPNLSPVSKLAAKQFISN